jgi:4-hydroxybenzoate polyprenyltransferase
MAGGLRSGSAAVSSGRLTAPAQTPLCVDLDGTLVKTNTLAECLIELVKRRPLVLLLLPFWLPRGRAYVWGRIGPQSKLNVALLPYRQEVLEFVRGEARAGRETVLVTGAHESIAAKVASHAGAFSAVMATSGDAHLVGARKAESLAEKFGAGGFDYIGDSSRDLKVWRIAREALIAGGSRGVLRSLRRSGGKVSVLGQAPSRLKSLWRALRPHQWVKNLLVFVPLMLGHKLTHVELLLPAGLAFLAVCAAGSAAYLMNDLLDLDADRRHDIKRGRPFASGDLPLEAGAIAAPALALAALALASLAGAAAAALLGAYLVLTSLYSLWLKRVLAVDVMLLAGLYCVRLLIGGCATGIRLSPWTVAFSMFLFLSLALMKRYAELHNLKARQGGQAAGRSYRTSDMQPVCGLGSASGMTAVLVIALYVNTVEVRALYGHPDVLWLVCVLVLLWITRLWFLAGRGELDEDPVLFAVKDPWSLSLGALCGVVILLAL